MSARCDVDPPPDTNAHIASPRPPGLVVSRIAAQTLYQRPRTRATQAAMRICANPQKAEKPATWKKSAWHAG